MCFSSGGRKSRQEMLSAEQNSIGRIQGTKEFKTGTQVNLSRNVPKIDDTTRNWLTAKTANITRNQPQGLMQTVQRGSSYVNSAGGSPVTAGQVSMHSSDGLFGARNRQMMGRKQDFSGRDKRFGVNDAGQVTFLGETVRKSTFGDRLQISRKVTLRNENQARRVFQTFGQNFDDNALNANLYRAGTEAASLDRSKVKDEASLRRRNRRARAADQTAAGTRRIQKKRQANLSSSVGTQTNTRSSGVRIPT